MFATRLSDSEAFLVKITSSRLGGVDEGGDLVAGALVERRGLLGEHVHAAVDIGVVPLVVRVEHVEDLARLLGSGRVVQVDELLPVVDHAVQDREVLADRVGVEEARQQYGHAVTPPFVT
ncbi:hypothetical protein GCM10020000_62060 [Streptomyces olivoverticillatus]